MHAYTPSPVLRYTIWHGTLTSLGSLPSSVDCAAMLAVLSYVVIEATFHIPVTSLTPFLFGKWYW